MVDTTQIGMVLCEIDEAQRGSRGFGKTVQKCQSYKSHGYFLDRMMVQIRITTVINRLSKALLKSWCRPNVKNCVLHAKFCSREFKLFITGILFFLVFKVQDLLACIWSIR